MGLVGKVLRALTVLVLGLAVVIIIRTATFPSMQPEVTRCRPFDTDFIQADQDLTNRFKEALRFRTITWSRYETDLEQVALMHDFLERSFPRIHSSPLVTKEVIGGHSLLYIVRGSEPNLAPYMLAAHLDVVPVSDQDWTHPPFGAEEEDGYIYGRGAIDDKHALMGIMEALEFCLKLKQIPKRTLYIAFGHDEEGHGKKGAGEMAKVLEGRRLHFEFILDEGTIVMANVFNGIATPMGMISIVEKGLVTLNLTVDALPTGHSSIPTPETNIGVLAKALHRLETHKQPIMFGYGPEKQMFEYLASEAVLALRVVLTNIWFFRPVFGWALTQMSPAANAFARTTTAVTMIHGGFKTNVLPPTAWAIVNHRIHPAQTVQQVMDHDRYIINDDRVKMSILSSTPPSFVSPIGPDSFGFQVVSQSIRQVFQPVAIVPGVMLGNTDTRHYWNLTKSIYRFAPTFAKGHEDIKLFHGINERISVKNYEMAVNFFFHVMQNADRETIASLHSHSDEL